MRGWKCACEVHLVDPFRQNNEGVGGWSLYGLDKGLPIYFQGRPARGQQAQAVLPVVRHDQAAHPLCL